jgi:hypothetical protein
VARYKLHATPYEQIANWSFVDRMLNFGEETILSTIKIRKAEPDPLTAVWEFTRNPDNARTISDLATVAIFFSGIVFGIASF